MSQKRVERLSHAVYKTRYHLVWAPKYRKWILRDALRNSVKELFEEILTARDSEREEMEIAKDHVQICTSIPPKYSVGDIVRVLKSVSAKKIFKHNPEVKKLLWGAQFWTSGFYLNTVGQYGNETIIKKYVKDQGKTYKQIYRGQLKLFEDFV